MSNFGEEYSKIYDALYGDKPYEEEADYIQHLFERYEKEPALNLIDLGCGTGRHTKYFLNKYRYNVTGVDLSAEMLEVAKTNLGDKFNAIQADISEVKLEQLYNRAVCLFHVFSYLTTESKINKFLKNLRFSLEKGSLFIFDFWHGPAVLKDRPTIRVREIDLQGLKAKRVSTPTLDEKKKTVNVNFKTTIYKGHEEEEFEEEHLMKYFSKEDLEKYMMGTGIELIDVLGWMSDEKVTDENWYGVAICRAV